MIKSKLFIFLSTIIFFISIGCATTKPVPIAYLSLEKPSGTIGTIKHNAVEKKFQRGGWYFGNYNFRPAPDVNFLITQTTKEVNSSILRGADIQFSVPFAFDILFFGYNFATDVTTATAK